jgi:tRNA U34 5-carboxymethylaminomethyl modifying enzyme MnmG/GidA
METKVRISVRYPGYIMRQSLVDESQKRYEQIKKQAESLYNDLIVNGLEETHKQALSEMHSKLIGEMKALRDINEWAKEHTAPAMNK